MEFTEYICPELLFLIPLLIGFGKMIKESRRIQDEFIPIILVIIGMVMVTSYYIVTNKYSIVENIYWGIVQGAYSGFASVWGNQIIKQNKKRKQADIQLSK